jgi:AraC-like DNA-binding protein
MPLKSIVAGLEKVPPGTSPPRHRHGDAYITLLLAGAFQQPSYAGRLRVQAGDIVLQPTLDCHSDHMESAGIIIVRIPWRLTTSLGGIYRGFDVEALWRTFQRDPAEAMHDLDRIFSSTQPIEQVHDWEDLVADRLTRSSSRIERVADELAMSRETMSRGFTKAYGVPPTAYRNELRARDACLRIWSTRDRLCEIALDCGFADQPHMTRAVKHLTGSTPSVLRQGVIGRRRDFSDHGSSERHDCGFK